MTYSCGFMILLSYYQPPGGGRLFNLKVVSSYVFLHRRNPRDFYPLHFPLLRSVTDRNPVGSDDGVSANLLCLEKKVKVKC